MGKKSRKKDPVLNLEDSEKLEDLLEQYGVVFEPESTTSNCNNVRPGTLRVFGRDYTINYVPEYMGLQDCGTTDNHNLLINIKDHQLPLEEADTLLHEAIHAIEYTMDLEMKEHVVRALATGLMGIFQDNPEFANYIIKPRGKTSSVE